jgi:hypothetical protein
MTDQTLLAKAKNIPVPEQGEIITIGSIELFCVWMKLNNRKVLRWQGNMLITVPDVQEQVTEVQDAV